MQDRIEQEVIDITSATLKIDKNKISLASSITDDLGADSLDQVELMMAIEASFNQDISDEDASKISTIADIVNYIKTKINPNQ